MSNLSANPATTTPTMDTDSLARRAAEQLRAGYRIDGRLEALAGERDRNFAVHVDGAPRFTAKLIHTDEPAVATAFQAALLHWLEQVDPLLPVPKMVATHSGADLHEFSDAEGRVQRLRVVTWMPGTPAAKFPGTPQARRSLGRTLGAMSQALRGFAHPGQFQDLDWDIRNTSRCRERFSWITDAKDLALAQHFVQRYEQTVAPRVRTLRHGVIYNDANDWNVLLDASGQRVCGIIDFGDAMHAPVVADLATAIAYGAMRTPCALDAAADIVAGFDETFPLEDDEFDCILPMAAARLCISVSKSAQRRELAQRNPYLRISEVDAWNLLRRLEPVPPAFARAVFRKACGRSATRGHEAYARWIAADAKAMLGPVFEPAPARVNKTLLALDGSDAAASQAMSNAERWHALCAERGISIAVGRWLETRDVYRDPMFASRLADGERRDLHLGLDLFAPAGTPVLAPLAARVVSVGNEASLQGYGGVLLLAHEPHDGVSFQTLWGHLDPASLHALAPGQHIDRGHTIGRLGDSAVNGGWPPHLHLQVLLDAHTDAAAVPGVGESRWRDTWAELMPDPAPLLGLPPELFSRSGQSVNELLALRAERIGRNLSISHREAPLKIVRGDGVWLIDDRGRAYLDAYNNVAHVGHEHPRVVAALTAQAARLNTNTRYLHDNIVEYAERLTATLPAPLRVCWFVNSGSEANDLALRMARAHTQRRDVLVLDWAYHGHSAALIDISPYKYKRPSGSGKPEHVHELALPDAYRRADSMSEDDFVAAQLHYADAALAALASQGRTPGLFIAETLPSVGGQIFPPAAFYPGVYERVRRHGGLCMADEVQTGFGRSGTMWAFEAYGVVPDIVTMGKPMGNGHPLAALITTDEVAASFANGMEYFNTFGGNPVSCAVGLAVLDVLRDENLIDNARRVGAELKAGLQGLMARHPLIGEVRGAGLFLGVELVTDRRSKQPATEAARAVVRIARREGVLIGTDGPHDNVIKLRPPMVLQREQAQMLVRCIDAALAEVAGARAA
jgi:4-aminobutyrate aminotransferase-like enzyme/Ser/Thr protein kinase RdoA (MazF antagonist)